MTVAAICHRLSGVVEAAKALAVNAAYTHAHEALIDPDASPGGYRRHAVREDDDTGDTYLPVVNLPPPTSAPQCACRP